MRGDCKDAKVHPVRSSRKTKGEGKLTSTKLAGLGKPMRETTRREVD
jgi:hypothetical protein